MNCGYAINRLHDEERERRAVDGDTHVRGLVDQSWIDACDRHRTGWAAREFQFKCGREASYVVFHARGDWFAYCPYCITYDLAVVGPSILVARFNYDPKADAELEKLAEKCCWIPRTQHWPLVSDLESIIPQLASLAVAMREETAVHA